MLPCISICLPMLIGIDICNLRGVPNSIGCMHDLLKTLQVNLKWIAVVVLVITILLLFIFILGLALCCVRKDEKDYNKKYN
jgi:hypothetical protein